MQAIDKHSLQCIHRPNEKKSTKSSNHLFFWTLPMTFSKNEKICYSDIMDQTWYSYNVKITNPNCLVKNSYTIPLGIPLAKSIKKIWSTDKWNYQLSMQSVHMHCASLSAYLPIRLSIYISLSRYACVYIFIYHSIYISLYMIIIKWYCFQIEQLKLWKWYHFMVNIYFNWHFFVASKVYIITIKWHNYIKWNI